MSYSFVLSSDLHIQPYIWEKQKDVVGDSYFSVEQIFDFSYKHDIPVLLAGDVFDCKSPSSLDLSKIGFLIEKNYNDKNLNTYFIQGQHEYCEYPWLNLFSGSVHVDKKVFTIDDNCFYGLDYIYNVKSDFGGSEEFKKIPKSCSSLLTHQVWSDIFSFGNSWLCFDDVPAHVQNILSGDFHKHFFYKNYCKNFSKRQPVNFYSPGSTYLRSVTEEINKYFFVFDSNFKVESIKIKTRPIVIFPIIENNETLDWLFDKAIKEKYQECLEVAEKESLPDAVRKPLFLIRCSRKTDDLFINLKTIKNRCRDLLGDSVHWDIDISNASLLPGSLLSTEVFTPVSYDENLDVNKLLSKFLVDSPHLFDICHVLLNAASKEDVEVLIKKFQEVKVEEFLGALANENKERSPE